jgi:hypothetical protein
VAAHHHNTSTDAVGQALSVVCMVHCAATPVLLGLAPALTGVMAGAHPVLLALVAATAAWAFVPGYRHHHKLEVPLYAGAGLVCLTVGALLIHDNFPLETAFTVVGAAMMLLAHWKNRQALKHCGG